jgi:two-component system sensor histidine kinase KdpD
MRRLVLAARIAGAALTIAAITAVYVYVVPAKPATIALSYLVSILFVATGWGIAESTVASLLAFGCFNFFFLQPVGTWTVADRQDWVALLAFLVTAIVASQLSGRARRRAQDAQARREDLERLYALSRALLLSEAGGAALDVITQRIAEAFGLQAVALYDHRTGVVSRGGPAELPAIEPTLVDITRRGTQVRDAEGALVMPLRLGGAPIGALAVLGAALSDTVLQSIANLSAIALERAHGREAAARAEAARASSELRAAVLDAVAHEFKTPLTSIKAAATELSDAVPPASRELVDIVREETDRLEAIVTDAVQMLRVESGAFVVHRERHDLAKLVAVVLRGLAPRLDGRRVDNLIPAGATVDADAGLVRLALRQLLDNAAKYSPAGSPIVVAASANGEVRIEVRNAGPAIPESEQPHVFDRFYRGLHARLVPGAGLGLAIVRQIAEAHGGSVRVDSTPAAGTAFILSLPREASA